MQSSHSTHITHCRYSNQQSPSLSPFNLLTFPTTSIQTTIHHHAVQSLYSHYPLTIFRTPTPLMQSSQSTHITHCRYSNHQRPSCSPVTQLELTTASIQIINDPHAVQSHYSYYSLPVFKSPTTLMHSSQSTHITNCQLSNHPPLMQSIHSTHIIYCQYSYQKSPTCSPVTLLILTTASVQITNVPHAFHSLYSH
jgi:hypothetical protein